MTTRRTALAAARSQFAAVDAAAAPTDGPRFLTAESACLFLFAGRATATVESLRTGARFTYKVTEGDRAGFFMVKVLVGSDNENSYQYLGHYRDTEYSHGRKSKIPPTAPSAVAFAYLAQALRRGGRLPEQLRVLHEGRCGACARKLTVPASILSGLGPDCAGRLGRAYPARGRDELAALLAA